MKELANTDQVVVFDANQNPDFLLRVGTSTAFPTLTRSCNHFWHLQEERFVRGLELASLHSMPFVSSVAAQLGVEQTMLPPEISNSQLCSMVGNSMHATCVGLALANAVFLSKPA